MAVEDGSAAAGRMIGELDVRLRTGATIVAVARESGSEINPGPAFRLHPGDTVVLLGRSEEIESAVEYLGGPATRGAARQEHRGDAAD